MLSYQSYFGGPQQTHTKTRLSRGILNFLFRSNVVLGFGALADVHSATRYSLIKFKTEELERGGGCIKNILAEDLRFSPI